MSDPIFLPGDRCVLRFPFKPPPETYPDYHAHDGQPVEVVRALDDTEANRRIHGPVYEVRAADGWTGDVFEDELSKEA